MDRRICFTDPDERGGVEVGVRPTVLARHLLHPPGKLAGVGVATRSITPCSAGTRQVDCGAAERPRMRSHAEPTRSAGAPNETPNSCLLTPDS